MKPEMTLFLLQSLDGKISTGAGDDFDVDLDIPKLPNASKGLAQYYEAEQETDLWSMVTGKTLAKIGINQTDKCQYYVPDLHRVILGTTALTEKGVQHLLNKSDHVVFINTNPSLNESLRIRKYLKGAKNAVCYDTKRDNLRNAMLFLGQLGCDKLTVQTGGTVNMQLVKEKLIDNVHLIIAPILVGGKNTPTLIDGPDRENKAALSTIGELKMVSCKPLKNSYLSVEYKVIK